MGYGTDLRDSNSSNAPQLKTSSNDDLNPRSPAVHLVPAIPMFCLSASLLSNQCGVVLPSREMTGQKC